LTKKLQDILNRCLGIGPDDFFVEFNKPKPYEIGFKGITMEGQL